MGALSIKRGTKMQLAKEAAVGQQPVFNMISTFNKELDESAFLVSIPMMDGKPLAADESQKFLFQYEEGEENRIVAGILSAGAEKTYASYIENGTEVQKEQTYHVGTESLAWYLDSQESILPGANGKLEFYIIPKKDTVKPVTVSFDINGYVYTTEGDKRAVKSGDTTLQNLMQGHILFFQQLDDVYGYQKWLKADESFIIEAPKNSSFQKDVPYKVTIYWIWPQYFRNYVYTQKSTQGDLFTDAANQKDDSDYARINTFINGQRKVETKKNKLFYDESGKVQVGPEINKDMAQDTLEQCSNYYNKADEYIGTNAKYIYVGIKVN